MTRGVLSDCTIEKPSAPPDGERLCWEPTCRSPVGKGRRKWCDHHSWPFRPEWAMNHNWWEARPAVLARANYRCVQCGSEAAVEVDHIRPMNGDYRAVPDCRNHQDNLRVLCHRCHIKVTAGQARDRAYGRRAGEGQGRLINL